MAFAIWNRTIQDEQGNVQAGASVEVRNANTNALATLYSNRDGTTLKTNPFLTDVNGYAYFFAVGGAYNVTASKGAYQMTFPYEAVGTSAETDFEQLAQMLESGVFPFQTVAQMNAFTPPSSPSAAVVYTGSGSGYYNWTGSAWSYSRALPDTFARLVVTGGTANAPVAAVGAGVNPSSPTVFFIDGVTPNTGSVTLTITGLGTGLVRNAAGGALSAGEWQGRIFFTRESNGEFKIVNDPASALAAAQSATLAGTRATAASNSATAAAGSATAAGNSATAAAGSATTASTQASNAAGSASAAAGSASAASTSAGNAASSATTATNQAGAAAGSASAAAGSATTAGTQATNAANSASAASTQAGAALTQANRAEDEADRAEAAASSIPIDAVRYGTAQTLTAPQQTQARANINAFAVPTGTAAQFLNGQGVPVAAPASGVTSVAGKTGAVTLVKGDVGLGNVDNTSDLAKPISTLTQTALNGKASTAIATTSANGLMSSSDKVKVDAIQVNATTNGYMRLPNGLILQWGNTNDTVSTASFPVNFPIAFPNACFSVVLTVKTNPFPASLNPNTAGREFWLASMSATNFAYQSRWRDGSAFQNTPTQTFPATWIAIGN